MVHFIAVERTLLHAVVRTVVTFKMLEGWRLES